MLLGVRRWRRAVLGFLAAGLVAAGAACAGDHVVLLLTADAEGTIHACGSCSPELGLGDIARRASAVAAARRVRPTALLVDSGNFLFGPDSLESGGRIIVAAYDALAYDAVNLTWRDFRLGKDATVGLVRTARFPVISANLVDKATGRLLAAPFVVRRAGGQRIAFVGVSELAETVTNLEHLRSQLAGVAVRPPLEALAEWLPKARGESDRVVLLFHGTAAGLDAVRRAHGPQFFAILAGGLRPSDLPAPAEPPIMATLERGTHLARLDLPAAGSPGVSQIPVDGSLRADPRVLSLVKSFAGR